MRPKTIGVIGGAGPLAGVLMLEYIFKDAQAFYKCHEDRDFPKIIMISYPFSDMLKLNEDDQLIRQELNSCTYDLNAYGAELIAIACNTLHVYLSENSNVINLLKTLADKLKVLNIDLPLVLCTTTSRRYRVHRKYFDCVYPSKNTQTKVDNLIKSILKDSTRADSISELTEIIESQTNDNIILGCTELSQLSQYLNIPSKTILDPLRILSKKIINLSFINN